MPSSNSKRPNNSAEPEKVEQQRSCKAKLHHDNENDDQVQVEEESQDGLGCVGEDSSTFEDMFASASSSPSLGNSNLPGVVGSNSRRTVDENIKTTVLNIHRVVVDIPHTSSAQLRASLLDKTGLEPITLAVFITNATKGELEEQRFMGEAPFLFFDNHEAQGKYQSIRLPLYEHAGWLIRNHVLESLRHGTATSNPEVSSAVIQAVPLRSHRRSLYEADGLDVLYNISTPTKPEDLGICNAFAYCNKATNFTEAQHNSETLNEILLDLAELHNRVAVLTDYAATTASCSIRTAKAKISLVGSVSKLSMDDFKILRPLYNSLHRERQAVARGIGSQGFTNLPVRTPTRANDSAKRLK